MDLFVDRLIKARPELLFLFGACAPVCETRPGPRWALSTCNEQPRVLTRRAWPCSDTAVALQQDPRPRVTRFCIFLGLDRSYQLKENQSPRALASYSIWTNLICRYKAINNSYKTTLSRSPGQKAHCTSQIDFRFLLFFYFPSEQCRPSAVTINIPQRFYFWMKQNWVRVNEGFEAGSDGDGCDKSNRHWFPLLWNVAPRPCFCQAVSGVWTED